MKQDHGFSLVPLDCPSCGAAIEAEGTDVVYYCSGCRNGYRYDQGKPGLVPVEVSFVSRSDRAVDVYKPFWLLPAEVKILHRLAKGQGLSGMLKHFFEGEDAVHGSGTGTFAVPAFRVDIERATEMSRHYTEALPGTGERLGERLVGGCFDVDDAKKLVHYGVVATEVHRSDLLTELRYEIQFGTPRLLGVPFINDGGLSKDAFFHLVV